MDYRSVALFEDFPGVVHHDELIYLFYISRGFPYFTKDSPKPEAHMVDKMTTLLANFAETG